MEHYPTVRIVYDRRKISSTIKESTVEIEISFEGKRKWISTGVRVKKSNWRNDKKVVGRSDALDANMKIEKLEQGIQNFIRKLMVANRPFTWSGLNSYLENNKTTNSFIEFVHKRVENRMDIQNSTRRNHRKFYTALKEFGKIAGFKDLTKQMIVEYDDWLHHRKDYTQSTIASYHKYMKIYINDALRLEYITSNPYDGFKVKQGKPKLRRYLTIDELYAIEKTNMPTDSLKKVKDMFIFQCYTGMAYSDIRKFDFTKVIKKGDRYVIHDIRKKTGEDFYLVFLPKALEVLEKYSFKLPIISNEQYNLRLKLVAMYAGISQNLTSHMGRHTFATMCLNNGVKIEVLAQMMGHSDIKTTQIYAKMVNQTVEDAYSILEDKLNSDSGQK